VSEKLHEEAKRLKKLSNNLRDEDVIPTEDELYRQESEKLMEDNEETFNTEVPITVELEEKLGGVKTQGIFAPNPLKVKRTRYFNRVVTGYEWNRYNQAHYDETNLPPKTPQGYKFNLFYPDLIDKSVPPTYIVERDSTDTVIVRFIAGPPYKDAAFRIVDREWERSRKFGFKCTFERGILRLWFDLKKFRYRR